MNNEKSAVGEALRVKASLTYNQAKKKYTDNPECIYFPTDKSTILFNGKEYRNTRYVYRHNVSKSELKTCMIIHKLYNKYYDNKRYNVNFRLAIKKFNNNYYKILTSKSSGFYK